MTASMDDATTETTPHKSLTPTATSCHRPKIDRKNTSSRIMKFPYILSFVTCMATVEAGVPKPEILVSMAFAAQERRDVTKGTKGLETTVVILLFLGALHILLHFVLFRFSFSHLLNFNFDLC
jgi:hypothetical protein